MWCNPLSHSALATDREATIDETHNRNPLAVILVAGGGVGGLIMLGIIPNPINPMVLDPAAAADMAAMELAAKTKFDPPMTEFPLVKVADLVVPVIISGQVQRRVPVIARILAATPADTDYIEANMNRFQNAVISDLVPYFQTYFADHDMVDVVAIKARL
ncbi:MAG: hypothetical protein EXQ84_00990, partial [Rhodospirillaceae bacterium]|nr:hypothetical protein [Rhodospirillaceae bacterium]